MSVKVFVYGTLRVGDCRGGRAVPTFQRVLAPVACVRGFEMLNLGGFPGLIQFEGEAPTGVPRIRGEVHEHADLSILDRIEGYRSQSPEEGLYNRTQVTVETPEGEIDECWVYTFNGSSWDLSNHEIIQSGDWFQHLEARQDYVAEVSD